MPKTITAKYPVPCPECGNRIRPGQMIQLHQPTREWLHPGCWDRREKEAAGEDTTWRPGDGLRKIEEIRRARSGHWRPD